MTPYSQRAGELSERLKATDRLLNQALQNLIGGGQQGLGTECAAALAQAEAELRVVTGFCAKQAPGVAEGAAIRKQLASLVPQMQQLERLLTTAAEFYRGWCAVAPAPACGYEAAGYGALHSHERPPAALLVLEA